VVVWASSWSDFHEEVMAAGGGEEIEKVGRQGR
jgi:hypothetical protein